MRNTRLHVGPGQPPRHNFRPPQADQRLPALAGGAIPNLSLDYFTRCLQLGWTSAYLYLGRPDDYLAIAVPAAEIADRDGPPTLAALTRVALAISAGMKGEHDREARILEELAAIELPPRTYTLLPVFEATRLFEAGNRREAFAKLGEAITEHLEAENMWSTNIICRRLLGLLARADHPTPVARLLGYYNAEGRSYSAWQTDLA